MPTSTNLKLALELAAKATGREALAVRELDRVRPLEQEIQGKTA